MEKFKCLWGVITKKKQSKLDFSPKKCRPRSQILSEINQYFLRFQIPQHLPTQIPHEWGGHI